MGASEIISILVNTGVGSALLFWTFLLNEKKSAIAKFFGVIGAAYIVRAGIGMGAAIGYYPLTLLDISVVETLFSGVVGGAVLATSYFITEKKRLVMVFWLFLGTIAAAVKLRENFFFLASMAGFAVMLVSFSEMLFKRDEALKRAGVLGAAYSILGLAITAAVKSGLNEAGRLFWIPGLLLLWAMQDTYSYASRETIRKKETGEGFFSRGLRAVIVASALTSFMFIASVAVHEVGHAVSAEIAGCSDVRATIYSTSGLPRTTAVCSTNERERFVTIGGIAGAIIAGIAFALSKERFLKAAGSMLIGFGLLLGFQDMLDMGVTPGLAFSAGITGAVFAGYGVLKSALNELGSEELNKSAWLGRRWKGRKKK